MNAATTIGHPGEGHGQFSTTVWSVVLAAQADQSRETNQALAQLCARYWYPLYSFIRRRGFNHYDAEDLTQEFFCRLLDRRYLTAVDYRKGRFRTFLLVALERFMAKEWRRSKALKRGGDIVFQAADQSVDERYTLETAAWLSPEKVYDQNCAIMLLEKALQRLRVEFESSGRAEKFRLLKEFLTCEGPRSDYAELARKLNLSEAAVKMTVSRMRGRYGELLRAEIANTVANPDEIEDELQGLLASFNP